MTGARVIRRTRKTAGLERRHWSNASIEAGGRTSVLIDSGPDVREQLLAMRIMALDGVVYTHDHADHTHGIDDLRVICYRMRRRIDAWADAATQESLMTRFGYCFESPPGRSYPPILNAHLIEPDHLSQLRAMAGGSICNPSCKRMVKSPRLDFALGMWLTRLISAACRINRLIVLQGLDVWIVDALRYIPHPAHFTVKQALEWIERLKPKRAILTHLHVDLDYDALRRDLPAHVEPAYDGMQIAF